MKGPNATYQRNGCTWHHRQISPLCLFLGVDFFFFLGTRSPTSSVRQSLSLLFFVELFRPDLFFFQHTTCLFDVNRIYIDFGDVETLLDSGSPAACTAVGLYEANGFVHYHWRVLKAFRTFCSLNMNVYLSVGRSNKKSENVCIVLRRYMCPTLHSVTSVVPDEHMLLKFYFTGH